VGFEPTRPHGLPVFETGAISLALPSLRAPAARVPPWVGPGEAGRRRPAGHRLGRRRTRSAAESFERSEGIEPSSSAWKAGPWPFGHDRVSAGGRGPLRRSPVRIRSSQRGASSNRRRVHRPGWASLEVLSGDQLQRSLPAALRLRAAVAEIWTPRLPCRGRSGSGRRAGTPPPLGLPAQPRVRRTGGGRLGSGPQPAALTDLPARRRRPRPPRAVPSSPSRERRADPAPQRSARCRARPGRSGGEPLSNPELAGSAPCGLRSRDLHLERVAATT
jgi:hypothetical protein